MDAFQDRAPICTVSEEDGRALPISEFRRRYRDTNQPVVLRNATAVSGTAFRAASTLTALVSVFGERLVTLSSANANSYGRKRSRLDAYIGSMSSTNWAETPSDQIFYLFGEHGDELSALLAQYSLPIFSHPPTGYLSDEACDAREPALSFGVAPDASGVPFHYHNDGFSEVLHGAKRWLLYPAHRKPPYFDPNATSISWLRNVYPRLHARDRPQDCIIWPGDLLYFPTGWAHAVVNIGTSVFMSTFL